MTTTQTDHPKSRLVTVCSSCLTAACWHGVFMCDHSRTAGLTTRTVAELDAAGREHPSHYSSEAVNRVERNNGPMPVQNDGGPLSIEVAHPSLPDKPGERLTAFMRQLPPRFRRIWMTDELVSAVIQASILKGASDIEVLVACIEQLVQSRSEMIKSFELQLLENARPLQLGDGTILVHRSRRGS